MHKRKTVTLRIPEDLLEDLRSLANYTGRSLNREAEIAIKKRCDYFRSRGTLEQHCSQTEDDRIAQEKYTAELLRLANWNWVPGGD